LVLSQRAYRRVQSSIKVTSQKSYLRKKEKNQQFINLTVCRIGVKKTYPIAYCNQFNHENNKLNISVTILGRLFKKRIFMVIVINYY